MTEICPNTSVIKINMNIFNSPIKRQRPYNFLKLQLYIPYKKHTEKNYTEWLEKLYFTNITQQKLGVIILISDKIKFKVKYQ